MCVCGVDGLTIIADVRAISVRSHRTQISEICSIIRETVMLKDNIYKGRSLKLEIYSKQYLTHGPTVMDLDVTAEVRTSFF